jgi:hypothetical protein
MNALSAPLLEELEAEIDRLDADDDVRAIVLVGAGERAFVAGADIKEFPSLREAAADANERGSARGIQKLGHRMDAARTPFVAAIHGFCLGEGSSCDASDIRPPPRAQLGSRDRRAHPGGGGTQRLRLVGTDGATWRRGSSTPPRRPISSWRRSCRRAAETALAIARTIAALGSVAVSELAHDARPPARGGSAKRPTLPPLSRARTARRAAAFIEKRGLPTGR